MIEKACERAFENFFKDSTIEQFIYPYLTQDGFVGRVIRRSQVYKELDISNGVTLIYYKYLPHWEWFKDMKINGRMMIDLWVFK